MKRLSANKKKVLEAKGWKSTTATEFLDLTPTEEKLVELKLAITDKFPNANFVKFDAKDIEFLLDSADENLNINLQKIFNLGNCRFSLLERTKDWKIRVVFSR